VRVMFPAPPWMTMRGLIPVVEEVEGEVLMIIHPFVSVSPSDTLFLLLVFGFRVSSGQVGLVVMVDIMRKRPILGRSRALL
jgi:hypothetical protein